MILKKYSCVKIKKFYTSFLLVFLAFYIPQISFLAFSLSSLAVFHRQSFKSGIKIVLTSSADLHLFKTSAQFLRLKFLREKVIQLERERDKKLSRSSEGTTVIANDSSMKMNTHISPDNAFPIFSSGLVDQIGYGVPT